MERLNVIRRTPEAETDLIEIWASIAPYSEKAADRVVDKIVAAIARLEHFPFLGRPREGALPGLRTLTAPPYLVAFIVGDDTIEVLRVIHGARDLSGTEFERSDPHRR